MSLRASFDKGARSSRSRWSTDAVLSGVKCLLATFSYIQRQLEAMRILEKLVRFLSGLIGLRVALQNQAEAEGFEPSVEVLAPTTV